MDTHTIYRPKGGYKTAISPATPISGEFETWHIDVFDRGGFRYFQLWGNGSREVRDQVAMPLEVVRSLGDSEAYSRVERLLMGRIDHEDRIAAGLRVPPTTIYPAW